MQTFKNTKFFLRYVSINKKKLFKKHDVYNVVNLNKKILAK